MFLKPVLLDRPAHARLQRLAVSVALFSLSFLVYAFSRAGGIHLSSPTFVLQVGVGQQSPAVDRLKHEGHQFGVEVIFPDEVTYYNRSIFVEATLGLANRFRVILSYLLEARKTNTSLVVYWRNSKHCPALFDEVFDQSALPADLTIRSAHPDFPIQSTKFAYPGRPGIRQRVSAAVTGKLALQVFKPIEEVQSRIHSSLNALGWPASAFAAGKQHC
jgi:hypothetical protein